MPCTSFCFQRQQQIMMPSNHDISCHSSSESLSEDRVYSRKSNSGRNTIFTRSRSQSFLAQPVSQSSSNSSLPISTSSNSDFENLISKTLSRQGGLLTDYSDTNLPAPAQFIDILSGQYSLSGTQAATLHNLTWVSFNLFHIYNIIFYLYRLEAI